MKNVREKLTREQTFHDIGTYSLMSCGPDVDMPIRLELLFPITLPRINVCRALLIYITKGDLSVYSDLIHGNSPVKIKYVLSAKEQKEYDNAFLHHLRRIDRERGIDA